MPRRRPDSLDGFSFGEGQLFTVTTPAPRPYAGGLKSKNDVLELLSRNPELSLNELRGECRRFRMDRRLEAWLRELKMSSEE